MKRKVFLALLMLATSYGHAWQTTVQNTPYGLIHIAWRASTSDSSVSLVLACVEAQRNATLSISTDNSVVGTAGNTEHLVFKVGRGSTETKGSAPSSVYARIREDGMGFYVGEGEQGLSMRAMIAKNDWMKVYWQFVAPSRGRFLTDILGQPSAEPQRTYTFDLRGFDGVSRTMSAACGW
jgi:hypothetical protein